MPKTKDALKMVERMVGKDRELRRLIAAEAVNSRVARMIYDARTQAGLTQKQLAKLVGTTQSVITRPEDADYKGYSHNMLNQIALALGKRVDIRLLSAKAERRRA